MTFTDETLNVVGQDATPEETPAEVVEEPTGQDATPGTPTEEGGDSDASTEEVETDN